MVKIALLIGVSEYQPGFTPLPAAKKDVEAMQRVLQNPELGGFDEVKQLINPETQPMREAIETLFNGRQKDDLLLLFFSGHGVKDDKGKLYLATNTTYKNPQGALVKSSAVAASHVHEFMSMSNCRSKRQVLILDCCFSGAFADGLSAKDDGFIDIKNQLGGEGRAVLTSSTSTQYSFEQQGTDLSIYTRYIIEGIETGEADQDKDGMISVDELHAYAREKVREITLNMNPEIYGVKEGLKIYLTKKAIVDPKVKYRSAVERCVHRSNGEISRVDRKRLDLQRKQLELSIVEAHTIETEVLTHYEEHKEKLQEYKEILIQEIQREFPFSEETRNELKRLQQALGLSDKDVALIEEQVTPRWSKAVRLPKRFIQGWGTQANTNRVNWSSVPQSATTLRKTALLTVIFLVIMGSVGGLIVWLRLEQPKKLQKAQSLVEEACNLDSSLDPQASQDRLRKASNLLNGIHNLIGIEDKTAKNELIKQIQLCNNQLNSEVESQKQIQEAQLKIQEATDFGSKAYQITFNPPPKLNIIPVEKWQEAEELWQKAINRLQSIPTSTSIYNDAQSKKTQYQKYLALVQDSLKEERKAEENLKKATELYTQAKQDIKNYKSVNDLRVAEGKLQNALEKINEIMPDKTTISSKIISEEKAKNETLKTRVIELKTIEEELEILMKKCDLEVAILKFRNENSSIELKKYLNDIDSYQNEVEQILRENLKNHNSVVESLFMSLNEYNFALTVLHYCDNPVHSCIVENGVLYIDENAPFKDNLIQKYSVQLQWKWNHLGKKYFQLNEAISKILNLGNNYREITKKEVEKTRKEILENIN
jgi:uncharacterized caspase-like protein